MSARFGSNGVTGFRTSSLLSLFPHFRRARRHRSCSTTRSNALELVVGVVRIKRSRSPFPLSFTLPFGNIGPTCPTREGDRATGVEGRAQEGCRSERATPTHTSPHPASNYSPEPSLYHTRFYPKNPKTRGFVRVRGRSALRGVVAYLFLLSFTPPCTQHPPIASTTTEVSLVTGTLFTRSWLFRISLSMTLLSNKIANLPQA